MRPGYPAPVVSLFRGLPDYLNRVDAVYERPADGNMVFFIGEGLGGIGGISDYIIGR